MTFKNPTLQDKPVFVIDEKNWFGNISFSHKGVIYSIDEIVSLKSDSITQTINFAPSYFALFEIKLLNGKVIKYKAASVFIQTNKVKVTNQCFDFLSKITFSKRIYHYLNQFEKNSCFQYLDYFIYDNGDVKHNSTAVNIAVACLQKGVVCGRWRGTILNNSYTPNEISVHQKIPGKFFKEHIRIKIKENRDVIYAILFNLAESTGGKVRFEGPDNSVPNV